MGASPSDKKRAVASEPGERSGAWGPGRRTSKGGRATALGFTNSANERSRVSLVSGAGHGGPRERTSGGVRGALAPRVRNERQRVSLVSGAGRGAPASEPVRESEGR